ncbi:MAG TPA: hypothetical protein VFE59_03830 [Trebonia sp.]|nr:hypothetical protein [Trebonia sp.]
MGERDARRQRGLLPVFARLSQEIQHHGRRERVAEIDMGGGVAGEQCGRLAVCAHLEQGARQLGYSVRGC